MYTDGQIINKQEHVAFANWNNANGGKFRSESLGNGTYKITEIVIPEPTEYEKAQARIAELKQMLAGSDYVVIKIAEGVSTADDYSEILNSRKAWRAEINELELVVDNQAVSD
jgi:hypothetical protein